jgi:hypothetical protein
MLDAERGVNFERLFTAAASFSICFGVDMRQLAGRSVMGNENIPRTRESSLWKVDTAKNDPIDGS